MRPFINPAVKPKKNKTQCCFLGIRIVFSNLAVTCLKQTLLIPNSSDSRDNNGTKASPLVVITPQRGNARCQLVRGEQWG